MSAELEAHLPVIAAADEAVVTALRGLAAAFAAKKQADDIGADLAARDGAASGRYVAKPGTSLVALLDVAASRFAQESGVDWTYVPLLARPAWRP